VIFLGISFIQKWCPLMSKLEKDQVKAMMEALRTFTQNFKSLVSWPSDVGVI
jgi:hypothetical protein